MNAGSASAPCSAPPAPTSGTARGTPTSHADDSTACRAPLANEAYGSLHPAHTEAAHRLCSFSGLLCQINYRRGLAFALGLSLRAGGVVFGYDPALGPRQGPSLRLGLMPRKPASLRLQTLGESLYLCSQTRKRVSSGPALDFSFSPFPTSQDTLTPGCRTDTQTLSEGQRSLNKEPVTINTVQGRGRGEGPDTVVSASRLQGPAKRVKRWEPSSGEGTWGGLGENQDWGSRARGPGKQIEGFQRVGCRSWDDSELGVPKGCSQNGL